MFILKRQDVEISSVQHPKTGQQIPILNYQGQTFRLIQLFGADEADEARAFWRDLTDSVFGEKLKLNNLAKRVAVLVYLQPC